MFLIVEICNENKLNIEIKLHVCIWYMCKYRKSSFKFSERIMHIKKSTPNFIVLLKFARLPLRIVRKERILKYWIKWLYFEIIV